MVYLFHAHKQSTKIQRKRGLTECHSVLTLNRTLADLLKHLIGRLCLNGEETRIKVQAYYDYFQEVLQHLGSEMYLKQFLDQLPPKHPMVKSLVTALSYHDNLANEFSVRSRETLDDTWREYWRDEISKDDSAMRAQRALIEIIGGGFDHESYIRDEFMLIRSAFPFADRNDTAGKGYYNYSRKGRSIDFQEKARRLTIMLLLRYEEYMFAGAMLDEIGLAQALFPSMKKLLDLPQHLQRRCVLIDEFQDFSTLELRLLKQIPTKAENGLFLTGDTVQKVLVKDFNLGNALLDRNYVRTRTIKKNYRNSRQILLAADSLIAKYSTLASNADDSVERLEPELAVRETAKPIAILTNRAIEAAWETARQWIVEGGNLPWSVCLVTANTERISLQKLIAKCPDSLKAGILSGDYVEQRDRVSIGTLSDVKGLEFSLIVLVGCSAGNIPSSQLPSGEQWRDAMRFYVAMTRGRDQVVMTYEGEPSEFLETMRPHLLWTDAQHEELFERIEITPKKEVKLRVIPSTPKPAYAQRQLILSPSADVVLRRYYERRIQNRQRQGQGRKFNDSFETWRTPEHLHGLRVSELFVDGEFRRDLAEEIDGFLRNFGRRLVWDK